MQIPVFQRGGSIIPSKERVRRCSSLMTDDPYTLTIALDTKVFRARLSVKLLRFVSQ